MENSIHEKYMKLCFELANKGAGSVSPNPLVGALIVKDDEIISTGYHKKNGSPHAEKNAIDNARMDINGSTLYCNLEPCVHTDKQTPPCVPAIISSGIKKVVISNLDPNPKVNGKGIEVLREAGIEVISGVLEEEGRELNRFFFKFMNTSLPYVSVKIAMSSDGKISELEGKQTWLTGKLSKEFVHQQRSIYDAVLVGANTVNIDNSKLTVREVEGRNPIRIILDGSLNSKIESNVFNDNEGETMILCSVNANEKKKSVFGERNIKVIEFKTGEDNKINLMDVLNKLSTLNITSLFVEGGGSVFNQFISQQMYDEIIVLKSPLVLGKGIAVTSIEDLNELYLSNQQKLGEDTLSIYKRKSLEDVYRIN